MSPDICFIGAGNLATQLSEALQNAGCKVVQVYSRKGKTAAELAEKLNCNYTSEINKITQEADIYFVAVKDDAIVHVLEQWKANNKLIVHCSGTQPLSILRNFSENTGVFYPLQTFSKHRQVNFSNIPVFVEANTAENEIILLKLANRISGNVQVLGSEKRKRLHISAVFACNFVNHCYTLAHEVLKTADIPFDVLKPLILETAAKVMEMNPQEAQTGPAVRFDENIISEHLKILEANNALGELYRIVTNSIFEFHSKKRK